MSPIRSERSGGVVTFTLDRPEALNALDAALLGELVERLEALDGDAALRCLILTGAGRAFAAGADIQAMAEHGPAEAEEFSRLGHRACSALESLAVPTLAAVNGFALGGGCELACACDWIYASEKARFGQPEVALGLIPGFGGTSRLARRVGLAWAKELALTGEPIDAQTALRIGLANRLFAPEELLPGALAAARAVASRGPLAVAAAKQLLQEGQDADVRLAHVLEQKAFAALAASEDAREGKRAFLEKRDPAFEGR